MGEPAETVALADRGCARIARGRDRAGRATGTTKSKTAGDDMNDDTRLRQELDRVSLRYRRVVRRAALAALWLALALVALSLGALGRGAGYAIPVVSAVVIGLLIVVVAPMLVAASR